MVHHRFFSPLVIKFATYSAEFVELHEEIKYALEMKNNVLAMKLLEQCQATALKLGNLIEAVKGRNFDTILTLDDY